MSCLELCDGDDCYQSENDARIFHIDFETKQFLQEHCKLWMNSSCDHICNDCVDNTNIDYPDFFIIDDSMDLSIGNMYIDNPELVK